MKMEINFSSIARFIPTIQKPVYKLTLKKKLAWTGVILILYYILSHVHVYGAADVGERFRMFEMLLGSRFGTLMTLGIGPIVTASILLQLMVGAKIINWNMSEEEDRKKFETAQKLFSIIFILLEATIYVLTGAVPPLSHDAFTVSILIVQLSLGGFLVFLMDDLISKWGIGSGISLFIAAGVADTIFIQAFRPFTLTGELPSWGNPPSGIVWQFLINLFSGNLILALTHAIPIISTILVFLIVIYTENISIGIPLTFSTVRGFGRRWGLKLFYTSNIPIILTAALLANLQLWGKMGVNPITNCGLMGCFDREGRAISGILYYLSFPRGVKEVQFLMLSIGGFFIAGVLIGSLFFKKKVSKIVTISTIMGTLLALLVFSLIPESFSIQVLVSYLPSLLTYTIFMVTCATIFSIFWVSTAGMDPESIADQIQSMGMQIPGYRSDKRIIKKVLERYIPPLAVIGGIAVGLLAAFADFANALGSGMGILLTVSILYNFYEQIKTQHPEEARPLIEKILGKK
jgi:preprotein translocase subunit SecY